MKVWDKTDWIPVPQRIVAVLWLSFLSAGVATGIFFSAIDPYELGYCMDIPELSRTAAYSIGFFFFWLLTGLSSLLTVSFLYPAKPDDDH